ncbi:hypothetical protein POSPLADRAFT_1044160 [Postia placenta MAD-698-R-SB12]|uniref:Cytochrome P450 n=1 Tax=Postia placenta MAD-698-R-SB12 TaxID=670580 RepID=A0A1X6N8G6_9APHY|nr:hypothetical protein POSPLADRAFT_1044160 [Postia placenta MAD-698-R-SB12]OSX64673.1 hypothetical protein POSPLADRAFT_1044160 [Postia placenta MAD-698-R-SB12]
MLPSAPTLATTALVVLLLAVYFVLPPGPRGLPLLGNVFQVPSKMPWLKFAEWKAVYGAEGPIFSLNMAGQIIVVLNTHKENRRSTIYSDRPRFIMASEILTGGIFMIFANCGEVWRKMRRVAHEEFNPRAAEKYRAMQQRGAALTILDILQDPSSWEDCLKQGTAASILTAVYGWPRITYKDKSVVTRIHAHTARIAAAVVPGAYLWKREGLEWHEQETRMFQAFNAKVREKKRYHGLSEKESAWLAGIMLCISASLANVVLALTLHPEVMHKAQAEIDAVVGRECLPTFAHQSELPYLRALIKETLRWRPTGPVDPDVFPSPEDFIPERFLDETGVFDVIPPDTHGMGHVNFGFGRRICAGLHFANQELFIQVAMLLWAFNFETPLDNDGVPLAPPKGEYIDAGIVVVPAPFECKLTMRRTDIATMIMRELEG